MYAKLTLIGFALALVTTPAYAGCKTMHNCPAAMTTGDPNYLKKSSGSTAHKPKPNSQTQPHS